MSSDIPAKYLGSLLTDLKRTDSSGKSVVRECHDLVMDILQEGNYRKAERECLRLLDSDNEDLFTWTLLGLTYLVLGAGDGAIEALDRSSRINNGVALNWTVYGDVMFGIDKVRTAGIHCLTTCLANTSNLNPVTESSRAGVHIDHCLFRNRKFRRLCSRQSSYKFWKPNPPARVFFHLNEIFDIINR